MKKNTVTVVNSITISALILVLSACGGGNSNNTPASIAQTPSSAVSLDAQTAAQIAAAPIGFNSGSASSSSADISMKIATANPSVEAYNDAAQQLYLAYFGRPADAGGLVWVETFLHDWQIQPSFIGLQNAYYYGDPRVKQLVDSFGTSPESAALYGSGNTKDFVTAIYVNLFNRKPEAAGLKFWSDAIDNGYLTKAGAALNIMAGAQNSDVTSIKQKTAVASSFTKSITNGVVQYDGMAAGAIARSLLQTVSATTDATTYSDAIATALASSGTVPHGIGSCKPYENTNDDIKLNDYGIQNNMWNKDIVKSPFTYTNCTYGAPITLTSVSATWNWSLPPIDYVNITGAVKGYPEIQYGWMPFLTKSTNTVLPMQVTKVSNITANYDMSTNTKDAVYDTIFDIWYISAATPTPYPSNVTAEVCIWVDYSTVHFVNQQFFVETITVDNMNYDVYYVPSAQNDTGHNVIQIVSQVSQQKASINVGKFTTYLLNKGYLNNTQYLSSIEFGSEPAAGSGTVNVKSYSITL